MTITTDLDLERQAVSDELREQWAAHDMVPLWESTNSAFKPSAERAANWRWSEMRPIMLETLKIALPSIIERRVIQLVNRSISSTGADATSGLMNATLQGLMPGELARPHRHTMNALRFVLEGGGAITSVNGVACAMETGDLITTPGMTWHEHQHMGAAPTIWLDVLDVYLHRVLGTAVFQPGPVTERRQAYDAEVFATANVVPVLADAAAFEDSPVYRYAWANTRRALESAPERADGSRLIRYVNPLTGGPCMSLIDCHALQLAAGRATTPERSASDAVISVIEGKGSSQIGDVHVDWQSKDTITVPRHAMVSHQASGDARLFIADNGDVYRRLGL